MSLVRSDTQKHWITSKQHKVLFNISHFLFQESELNNDSEDELMFDSFSPVNQRGGASQLKAGELIVISASSVIGIQCDKPRPSGTGRALNKHNLSVRFSRDECQEDSRHQKKQKEREIKKHFKTLTISKIKVTGKHVHPAEWEIHSAGWTQIQKPLEGR